MVGFEFYIDHEKILIHEGKVTCLCIDECIWVLEHMNMSVQCILTLTMVLTCTSRPIKCIVFLLTVSTCCSRFLLITFLTVVYCLIASCKHVKVQMKSLCCNIGFLKRVSNDREMLKCIIIPVTHLCKIASHQTRKNQCHSFDTLAF